MKARKIEKIIHTRLAKHKYDKNQAMEQCNFRKMVASTIKIEELETILKQII